jgi:AraC-like DNA-binding protein
MLTKAVDILEIGAQTGERIIRAGVCPSLTPYDIPLAGVFEGRDGFHFERSSPNFVYVLASVSGEGEVLVDGDWKRCGPHHAYIAPANSPHAYRALPGKVWYVAWVHYWPNSLSFDLPATLKPADPQPLESSIIGLYREFHGAADPAVLASWSHLIDVAARRLIGAPLHDPRLNRLWEVISADLVRPWTLAEMAQLSHMSAEHLRRLCNARFGRSPLRQLAYLRLRRGAELLVSSDAKIDLVARQVGYENAFAFSAAFKREIGVSPSSFRR